MSFEIPYKTLTPILGKEAPYNPSEETTPKFMNGKFNELLENDKALENQINVLNDKSLLNQDLNTKDIDKKTQENYIVGISEDGHGIIPFPEWNSIVQFSCSHFLSQLGFKINGTEARLAIRSTYALDDSDWQIWTELATVEVKKVELLNGWQTQDGSATATICKTGNHISFVHTLKNDNVVSVAPIFVSPYTFDSSEIVKYGTISFSADVVSAIACLPDGTVRYEGSNTGSRQYVGVNLQYDIK